MAEQFELVRVEPPPRHRTGRKFKYPWGQMEVGHSFFVPPDQAPGFNSLRTLASNMGVRLGAKFRVVPLDDGRLQVYREA